MCIRDSPVPNLPEALRREPKIAERARLIVMGGSVYRQYNNKPGRCAEYNVRQNIPAARIAYTASWPVTMAPLDTAGTVVLQGQHYARVRDADNPLAKALMENYRTWAAENEHFDPNQKSSILYDAVPVYLAFDTALCTMQDIRLQVTNEGLTEPNEKGKKTQVATNWKNLEKFKEILTNRIANYRPTKHPGS